MSGGLLLLLPAFSARSWSIRACQNRGNAREHDGVSDLRWKTLHYTFGNESRRGFADLLSLSLGPAAGASVIHGHGHQAIACVCHRRQTFTQFVQR
jgi:hypothetical protein